MVRRNLDLHYCAYLPIYSDREFISAERAYMRRTKLRNYKLTGEYRGRQSCSNPLLNPLIKITSEH